MFNIKIKTDCTDHFSLYCSKCDAIMTIKKVETIETSGTKCTYLKAKCSVCSAVGQRKIYWRVLE